MEAEESIVEPEVPATPPYPVFSPLGFSLPNQPYLSTDASFPVELCCSHVILIPFSDLRTDTR